MSSIDVAPPTLEASEPAWARACWAVHNVCGLVFTLLFTSVGIVVALLLRLISGSPRLPLRMAARVWSPVLFAGAGARLAVEGADRIDWSKPRMIVANHQSFIDICALFAAVPVPLRFVMKHELGQVPFLGRYARTMGMVFIERDSRRAGSKMLRETVALLRDGATLVVFPEGTRSRDGRIGPFKGGAFQAAIDAGVDVLPVTISGAAKVMAPDRLFRIRSGRILVRFGAPLATDDADRMQLAERARGTVLSMLEADA